MLNPRSATIRHHFQYAALDGRTALPVNIEILDTLTENALPQKIQNIKKLGPELQELAACVKEISLNSDDIPFREAGAFAAYHDGTLLYDTFTSNMQHQILGDDMDKSMFQSGLLDRIDQGNIPDEVIHIHTHPGPEHWSLLANLLISAGDFSCYRLYSEFLSNYAGQDVPVRGIVVPVSDINNHTYIETMEKNLGPARYEHMEQLAEKWKTIRKQGIHPPACPLTISCSPQP